MDSVEKVSMIDDLLYSLHLLLFNEDKEICKDAINKIINLINSIFNSRFEN